MKGEAPKGVVLLSGGVDSATVAALARAEGFQVHALTVSYGQRHAVELDAARRVGQSLGVVEHVFATVDLDLFGGSALTADIDVPKRPPEGFAEPRGIPVTYVPARNTVLLAMALAFAEAREAVDIFVGVNAVDYSGYPDCRPAFLELFEKLAHVATRMGVEGANFNIHAPLIHLTKAQIIQTGVRLGVDFALTHSCYDPDANGRACGACESCLIRRRGFKEAGVEDPTPYS